MLKKKSTIQKAMFADLANPNIFHQAQEYALDYANQARERNVFPTQTALDNLAHFEEDMPLQSTATTDILAFLNKYGAPATVQHNIGGRYFGFVTGGVVPASLAAKWMADFWDQIPAMDVLSPIGGKLEAVVEKWLQQLFGLSEDTIAGFVSGSSMAIFCGLVAGRYRILERQGWDVNAKGLNGAPPIRVITGKHTHSTVKKAIATLGLGLDNVEWVDVDDQGRMLPNAMPPLDDTCLLILQAGNVNSGSFDDFETICTIAQQANAWVHVDGAFGLWAACAKQLKHLTKGMEKANSFSVDGHKTLNTPYDSGVVLCNDRAALISALQATGAYILYDDNKRDGMRYTPEMSRRARVIEMWAALKFLGKQGVDEMIYGMHERSVQFARELKANGFEVLNDVVFNQIIVRYKSDELTRALEAQVQALRECWAGGSQWFGQQVIRISVCSWATTEEDVSRSVASFVKAKEMILKRKN